MSDQPKSPRLDLSRYFIDPEVVSLIPEKIATEYCIIPLFKLDKDLTVASADPDNIFAIDEIAKLTNLNVDFVAASSEDIRNAISQYYKATDDIEELVQRIDDTGELKEDEARKKDDTIIEENAPTVDLVNSILKQAIKDKASDIHVEPEANKLRIRFRVDGILREVKVLPKWLQDSVISRIKVISNMDISENRRPQDGRTSFKMDQNEIDMRVSTYPTQHGENTVLRLFIKDVNLFAMPNLGFLPEVEKQFLRLIQRSHGIILVTGPTGSGKTTTLYAALNHINTIDRNIITIEDPIEYQLPLIRQGQVNVKAGITFADGLRSILRQDPDVIMIGEIRDAETAQIAIRSALTGHLVFSTLHTNDAPSSPPRLIDMGTEAYLVASSLICVLSQRLVRKICQSCKTEYQPETDNEKELMHKHGLTSLWHGVGCKACNNTGYRGRICVTELMEVNNEIKSMIMDRASATTIREAAVRNGMLPIWEDGIIKVRRVATTLEEVIRVTSFE